MVGADSVIRGPALDLTDPQALSLDEIAAIIGAATGRAITYHPETLDEANASRAAFGAPDWQVPQHLTGRVRRSLSRSALDAEVVLAPGLVHRDGRCVGQVQ